jgi:hypothetical protein
MNDFTWIIAFTLPLVIVVAKNTIVMCLPIYPLILPAKSL